MRAFANIELTHAFVVTKSDIEKIWSLLSDAYDSVNATASCTDNLERTFNNPQDLLNYENSRAQSIRSLHFETSQISDEGIASIRFGNRYSGSVEFRASGPEEKIIPLKNRIAEIVDGTRQWYSPLSRIDFTFWVWGMALFAMMIVQFMSDGSAAKKAFSFTEAITAGLALSFIGVLLALASIGLNKMRRRFFPVATFAIGQGLKRYEFDNTFRWVVIIGFAISIFSTIVGTLIS